MASFHAKWLPQFMTMGFLMVEISIKTGHAHKQRDDAVVLPLLAGRKLTGAGNGLQEATANALTSVLRKFDLTGEFGEAATLYDVAGTFSKRVVLIGIGEEKKLTLQKLRILASQAVRKLDGRGSRDISLFLPELAVRGAGIADKVQAVAEGVWLGLYKFDKYQTQKKERGRSLRSVTIMVPSRGDLEEAEMALSVARAVAIGTN